MRKDFIINEHRFLKFVFAIVASRKKNKRSERFQILANYSSTTRTIIMLNKLKEELREI